MPVGRMGQGRRSRRIAANGGADFLWSGAKRSGAKNWGNHWSLRHSVCRYHTWTSAEVRVLPCGPSGSQVNSKTHSCAMLAGSRCGPLKRRLVFHKGSLGKMLSSLWRRPMRGFENGRPEGAVTVQEGSDPSFATRVEQRAKKGGRASGW